MNLQTGMLRRLLCLPVFGLELARGLEALAFVLGYPPVGQVCNIVRRYGVWCNHPDLGQVPRHQMRRVLTSN